MTATLWDHLTDSKYDGVDLLVVVIGIILLIVALCELQNWLDSRYMDAERPPRGPEPRMSAEDAAWAEKFIQGVPDMSDDPYVQAFLYGTDMPPLPRTFTVEKTTPINQYGITPKIATKLSPGMKSAGMALAAGSVPGTRMVVAAASEEQARARMDAYRLMAVGPEPSFDPDWHRGFRVVPRPPYDWQREDSGLA